MCHSKSNRSDTNMQFVMWFEKHTRNTQQISHQNASSTLRTYFDRQSAHELNLDEDVKLATVDAAQKLIGQHKHTPLSIFLKPYDICCSLLEYSSIPAYKAHRKARERNEGCSRRSMRSIGEALSRCVSVIDVRRCL